MKFYLAVTAFWVLATIGSLYAVYSGLTSMSVKYGGVIYSHIANPAAFYTHMAIRVVIMVGLSAFAPEILRTWFSYFKKRTSK
jgi:hypothetical protein